MSIMSGITMDRSWSTCVSLLCSHNDFKKNFPSARNFNSHFEGLSSRNYVNILLLEILLNLLSKFPMVPILHQSNVQIKSYDLEKLVSCKRFEFSHYLYSSWYMSILRPFRVRNWVIQMSLESLGHQFYFCSLVWEKQTLLQDFTKRLKVRICIFF